MTFQTQNKPKQVKKVVIYYTDGTYTEVEAVTVPEAIPKGPVPRKIGPIEAKPATEPLPSTPYIPFTPVDIEDPYVWPGQAGKWPSPPFGTGVTIVD